MPALGRHPPQARTRWPEPGGSGQACRVVWIDVWSEVECGQDVPVGERSLRRGVLAKGCGRGLWPDVAEKAQEGIRNPRGRKGSFGPAAGRVANESSARPRTNRVGQAPSEKARAQRRMTRTTLPFLSTTTTGPSITSSANDSVTDSSAPTATP